MKCKKNNISISKSEYEFMVDFWPWLSIKVKPADNDQPSKP